MGRTPAGCLTKRSVAGVSKLIKPEGRFKFNLGKKRSPAPNWDRSSQGCCLIPANQKPKTGKGPGITTSEQLVRRQLSRRHREAPLTAEKEEAQ
jgi:hypothetical protein